MAFAGRLVSMEVFEHEIGRMTKAGPQYSEFVEALNFQRDMLMMQVENGLLTPSQYLDNLRKAIAADFTRYKQQGDKVAGTHVVIMKKELAEAEAGGLA